MTAPKPLIPPDPARCQTEITTYRPFVMGGPVKQVTRCENAAAYIATEKTPDENGQRGAMSVCRDCKQRLVAQFAQKGWELPALKPIKRRNKTK